MPFYQWAHIRTTYWPYFSWESPKEFISPPPPTVLEGSVSLMLNIYISKLTQMDINLCCGENLIFFRTPKQKAFVSLVLPRLSKTRNREVKGWRWFEWNILEFWVVVVGEGGVGRSMEKVQCLLFRWRTGLGSDCHGPLGSQRKQRSHLICIDSPKLHLPPCCPVPASCIPTPFSLVNSFSRSSTPRLSNPLQKETTKESGGE